MSLTHHAQQHVLTRVRALTSHVPEVKEKVRTIASTVRTYGPAIYGGLVRPLDEKTHHYLVVSREIARRTRIDQSERELMDRYVLSLLLGDGSQPAGLTDLRACQVRQMLTPWHWDVRVAHPLRAWHWPKQYVA